MKKQFLEETKQPTFLYWFFLFISASLLTLAYLYEVSFRKLMEQINHYVQQSTYQAARATIKETTHTILDRLPVFIHLSTILIGGLFVLLSFFYIRRVLDNQSVTPHINLGVFFKKMILPLLGIFLIIGVVLFLFQPQIEKSIEHSQFSLIKNNVPDNTFSIKDANRTTRLTVKAPTTIQALAQTNRLSSVQWTQLTVFTFLKIVLILSFLATILVAYFLFTKKRKIKKIAFVRH